MQPVTHAQRGFTLLELSIVLVVIGLIIGGVLIGQEMVTNQQVTRMATDARQYSAAVGVFLDKYKQMPGDFTRATKYWGVGTNCATTGPTTGTCDGNGDGYIGTPDGGNDICLETIRAWQHLGLAGIISGSYSGRKVTSGNTCSVEGGQNAPKGALRGGTYTIISFPGAGWVTYPYYGSNQPYLIIAGSTGANGESAGGDGAFHQLFTTTEAYSVDKKMDDGLPGRGTIQSFNNGAGAGYAPGCTDSSNSDTAQYVVASDGIRCPLVYWP